VARKEDRYTTPFIAFLLYAAGAFIVVCVFRLIFPGIPEGFSGDLPTTTGQAAILDCFRMNWRLSGGVITFIYLFPVFTFSALVIPFGLKEHTEGGYAGSTFVGKKGFSAVFLKYLTWPIITASAAAVLYGLLFFLALPLAVNARTSMEDRSELYREARKNAEAKYAQGNMAEALHFTGICDKIWQGSKEIEELKAKITDSISPKYSGNGVVTEQDQPLPIWQGLPGNPVTSADALRLAEEAFKQERYYDANWLAVLTQRLAEPGAAEITAAVTLAARAWEKITGLAPNAEEEQRYSLYHMKRDGFEAMVANDWISAYYIFSDLSALTPDDPDVKHYLENCKSGVSKIAFFLDEMDLAIGNTLTGTIFSLLGPLPSLVPGKPNELEGRLALRFSSLAVFPDYAYAWGTEAVAADKDGNFRFRLNADYAKLLPASTRDSGGETVYKTALLVQALDRNDKNKRHDPLWASREDAEEHASAGISQLMLNIGYEDFLLLSKMKQGTGLLNLWQLFTAEKKFGVYGYVPEIFRAEILRRLGDAVFFLPMAVLAMVLGWRYRARKKPRYIYVPMMGILPLVFFGAVFFYRNILNNLAIQLSLSMGFTAALICLTAGAALCFILTLILLAAQHG